MLFSIRQHPSGGSLGAVSSEFPHGPAHCSLSNFGRRLPTQLPSETKRARTLTTLSQRISLFIIERRRWSSKRAGKQRRGSESGSGAKMSCAESAAEFAQKWMINARKLFAQSSATRRSAMPMGRDQSRRQLPPVGARQLQLRGDFRAPLSSSKRADFLETSGKKRASSSASAESNSRIRSLKRRPANWLNGAGGAQMRAQLRANLPPSLEAGPASERASERRKSLLVVAASKPLARRLN